MRLKLRNSPDGFYVIKGRSLPNWPTTTAAASTRASAAIPEETAGPFPGDGSNGPNVLAESGIVRSDITRSFGSASGVAKGVPLTIRLKVLDTANGSVGREGAAVYLWHCDIDGRYSLYSEGVTQENYLRGVQETGGDGSVTVSAAWKPRPSGRGGNAASSLRCRS